MSEFQEAAGLQPQQSVTDTDLEVLVVVQPKAKRSWPPGYFAQTAGSLADDPIARPSQGTYEERDALQ